MSKKKWIIAGVVVAISALATIALIGVVKENLPGQMVNDHQKSLEHLDTLGKFVVPKTYKASSLNMVILGSGVELVMLESTTNQNSYAVVKFHGTSPSIMQSAKAGFLESFYEKLGKRISAKTTNIKYQGKNIKSDLIRTNLNGTINRIYQVPIREDLAVLAVGPDGNQFDQKSFSVLLGSKLRTKSGAKKLVSKRDSVKKKKRKLRKKVSH